MEVLMALGRTPGVTVRRDALIRDVWGDTAVTDDALQRCVSVLRRTLGRGELGVRIETIPKIGYRLVVENPPAAVPDHRLRWIAVGSALAIAMAVILGAMTPAWQAPGGTDGLPAPAGALVRAPSRPTVRPLTAWPGHEMSPSLSRDGSHVAFIQRRDGVQNLFVTVGDAPPLQLTNTSANEHAPAYAPDGKSIAFARTESDRCAIYRVAPTAGPAHRLFACTHAARTELAWSPDGARLAYVDRTAPDGPRTIRIVDIASGERWGPEAPTGGVGDGDLSFSPDGRTLAFSRSPALGVEDVFLFDLPNRRLRRLTKDNIKIHGLSYIAAQTIVVSSNRAGSFGLWKVDLQGGPATRIAAAGRHHDAPSAAGDQIVYEAWQARVDLFASTPDGHGWTGGDSRAEIGSTHFDWHPAVNHRGDVAFVSDRSGSAEIWVRRRGAELVRLTRFEGPYVQGPAWSPDGRWLVFAAPVQGNFDLFRTHVDGGPVIRLTHGSARDRTPTVSADGNAVFFASDDSGKFMIRRLDLGTGRHTPVCDGYAPRVVGSWLYYTKPRQNGLFRRPLETPAAMREVSQEERVLADLTPVDARNWVADGPTSIVFVHRPQPARPELVRLDLTTRQRRTLSPLPKLYHRSGLALGPDRRLWWARVISSETDLYRIEGVATRTAN